MKFRQIWSHCSLPSCIGFVGACKLYNAVVEQLKPKKERNEATENIQKYIKWVKNEEASSFFTHFMYLY